MGLETSATVPVNSQEKDYKVQPTLNQHIYLNVLFPVPSLFDTESLLFTSGTNFISLLIAFLLFAEHMK